MMTDEEELLFDELMHVGILRKSGRYPWGSGENPHQRNREFLTFVEDMRKRGMTETEIAKGVGITTTQLRALKTIAKNEARAAKASQALRLKESGMSNVAIGVEMGINESSVRDLLNPVSRAKDEELAGVASMLKDNVSRKGLIDVGEGVENHLGISQVKLSTAIAMLEDEGYVLHKVDVEQLGTGHKTRVKVLCPPGTEWVDVLRNQEDIKTINDYSDDGGKSFSVIKPPLVIDPKRVNVRYAEEGGSDMDGVILVRRGTEDLSLGDASYAQVRIAVGGKHFLKGMAMYSDDLPDGVDLVFNTNKSDTGNKLDAMKPMKTDKAGVIDDTNPFGSVVRQLGTKGADGRVDKVTSAMNIVNEEGDWFKWSKTLSSQMMSKQKPQLAKEQLDLAFDIKKAEFDQIASLTNPAVRRKLLESFADGADSSAVHLKAAGLPRTRNHVILPIPDMKDTEIYAPQYKNGERVVLIRHPHGGIFEIPELTVNNRHPSAKKALGQAIDAVGISPKTAGKLSGADFDGDTVLVIPNNSRSVKTAPSLAALKNFEPQKAYPQYAGMKVMDARTKGREMGGISNLITDMTIKAAPDHEIARAVRHSMVVIDAEKHKLNYKQSAKDHNIAELKVKYQGRADAGASTLISRASSTVRVAQRKDRAAKDGGAVDPTTGKKVYTETGAGYTKTSTNKRTGVTTEKFVLKLQESKALAETDDAHTLSSKTPVETVYANHSNRMKALANTARKSALETKSIPYSPTAKKVYAPQVSSLNAKLNLALKNKPLERQAQILANAQVKAKTQANPDTTKEELKKLKGLALEEARRRTGASKQQIRPSPEEWEAIQAGAISNNKLEDILKNADLDVIKSLATPRANVLMNAPTTARAKNMMAAGYTQSEIAEALGVSTSTLTRSLTGEDS